MPGAVPSSRGPTGLRPVWAEVDLAAVAHNAGVLARLSAPARLCAVVKADGYGHGAVEVARAALDGGASWLAVALVEEGALLRQAGIRSPILLLAEPPPGAWPEVVRLALTPTLYTAEGGEEAAKAVAARRAEATGTSPAQGLAVHVKVDTGMHRVGALPADAVRLARAVAESDELELEGLWTHFAVADDPGHPFNDEQARSFAAVLGELAARGARPPLVHACNSAATLTRPHDRGDLARCGISLYGVAPSPALEGAADRRPALTLRARVSLVKEVAAGEGISYGLRHRFERRSILATVPVGYADGVPWSLSGGGGEVLVGGRRRPIAGAVTMDQITVDCGHDQVRRGDDVVLLGQQGDERVGPWEWARRSGTIAYEVLCRIGPRVPRVYV